MAQVCTKLSETSLCIPIYIGPNGAELGGFCIYDKLNYKVPEIDEVITDVVNNWLFLWHVIDDIWEELHKMSDENKLLLSDDENQSG